MKRILLIAFTDLARDPRVKRQIAFLKDEYEIFALGTGSPGIENVNFICCLPEATPTKFRKLLNGVKLLESRFEEYYWSRDYVRLSLEKAQGLNPDIIIANDIDTLPLAMKLSRGAKVILDAHEYAPKEFEDSLKWRLLYQRYKEYLCSEYIPQATAVLTVGPEIAREYNKNYKVDPVVITNAPNYHNIQPRTTNPDKIRMIFHGGANSSRKLENMIEVMNYVDERFYLDFMLNGSSRYIRRLRHLAKGNARIRFLPTVPMEEVSRFISQYDIGLYLLEPNSFNNLMALPNKFFEFIQARLAIAIGPSPEMASLVKEYDCGIVSEDFRPLTLARKLNELSVEKIDYFKTQTDKFASIACAEVNKGIFLDYVKKYN
ncbi:MAG: glycosyltransferase family protein [Desulfosporosinus fructosivorans]